MLRAVLGVCGVGLIAFGVFGGSVLESMHRGISGVFTPDTVVVAEVAQEGDSAVQPVAEEVVEVVAEVVPAIQEADNVEAQADANMIVLASSEGEPGEVLKAVSADTVEGEIVSAEVAEPKIMPALLEEGAKAPAETLATASKAVEKSTVEFPDADELKAEGVEIVLSSTTGLPPNDTLFVLKERVNMREGPSTKHPIVLQLDVGQELMEFKRDGKWVHVGAYGTAGKIGWVHNTLVGTR